MQPIDANQMLLNEGNRQVVLHMLGMAETSVVQLKEDIELENLSSKAEPESDLGI